jgi:adenine deaminase
MTVARFPRAAAPTSSSSTTLRNSPSSRSYRGGQLVARDGRVLPQEIPPRHLPIRNSMNINWSKVDVRLPTNGHKRVRVIGMIPDQITTTQSIEDAPIKNGFAVSDPARDLLKVAVIERHQATGNVGIGFVRGVENCDAAPSAPPSRTIRTTSSSPERTTTI